MHYVVPNALFDGSSLITGKALRVEGEVVVEIVETGALRPGASVEHVPELLTPGFFDVQVNGGGGVMLNNAPTPEGVQKIATAHRAQGTAYILPTVITDAADVMERAAGAVMGELGKNGVLGIHIEGPHINPRHKGTHNPAFIRPFDESTMSVVSKLREHHVPVLLTLAPELVEPGLIDRLTRMGVRVSAGHSAANEEETVRAIAEGMCCFTHLFNGMPQMTSRAPMIAGTAIGSQVWCAIIADGHHVADEMVAIAFRARPVPNRMILVSDAMSTIGGPDHFELYGERIQVKEGRLVNAEESLAGAHINLKDSVSRAISTVGIDPVTAIRSATLNPFEMMQVACPMIVGEALENLGRVRVDCKLTGNSGP